MAAPAAGKRRGPAASPTQGGQGKHRGAAAAESTVSKGAVKKAAAAEVAGGGPEDPLADAAAAGALFGGKKKSPPSSGGGASTAPAIVKKNPVLLAEFIVCFVILGLGTIVTPNKTNQGIPRLMLKSSALAGLFLILALVSSAGGQARKTAGALGGLVTLTYIVASSDAIAIFNWASSYFPSAYSAGEAIGNLAPVASTATEGNTSTPPTANPGGGSAQ